MPALWFANQGWPSQDNQQPYVFVFDGGRSTSVIPKLPILSCLGDFSIDTVPEQHAEVGVISNASSPDLSLTDTAPPPTLLKRRARSNSSASWMKCLPSTSIAPVRLSQLVGQQLRGFKLLISRFCQIPDLLGDLPCGLFALSVAGRLCLLLGESALSQQH